MPIPIVTQGITFLAENIAAAEAFPAKLKLYPAELGTSIALEGKEAKTAREQLVAAGFVDLDNLLLNGDRLVFVEKGGAVWKAHLAGCASPFALRGQAITTLSQWLGSQKLEAPAGEAFPAQETAPVEKTVRRKKGDSA